MDRELKRICTIAARGGSKEVKNKNIREILNKPLLAHTIIGSLSGKDKSSKNNFSSPNRIFSKSFFDFIV